LDCADRRDCGCHYGMGAIMDKIVGFMVWKDNPGFATPIFDDFDERFVCEALFRIKRDLTNYGREQDVTIDDVLVYKIGDMLRPVTKTVWE
jgi:hypothetical protein